MVDPTELRIRAATIADAAAIAEIYNQGIADRVATFETEPRSAADIVEWFTRRHLVVVVETRQLDLSPLPLRSPIATGPATAASANSRFMSGGTIAAAASAAQCSLR